MKRIEREKNVVAQMIRIYCHDKHKSPKGTLCEDCESLLAYAHARLSRCPHGENKSSCRKCATHCYAPSQRAAMRDVMRYVGPRMLWHSPIAAIRHLISELN